MGRGVDVAVYPATAIDDMGDGQLEGSLSYLDPDVILVEQPYHRTRFSTHRTNTEVRVIGGHSAPSVTEGPGPQLVTISSPDDFTEVADLETGGKLDTTSETFVVSNELAVNIDLTNLETELEGKREYKAAMQNEGLSGTYTHLTPHAAPEYRHTWGDEFRVQGIMPGADETGVQPTSDIAHLKLYADSTVAPSTISAGRFGLQGLAQVGPKTAGALRDAGFTAKQDIAGASVHDLRQIEGVGKKTAQTIQASATARINGEVYRTSSDELPRGSPVFIDIETDGLSPTMVWLIGVLDSRTDQYMSFMATDPDAKGDAVEAFAMWYTGNAAGRPVIAYNGDGFDFPVLHDHINQYCPEYLGAWQDAWTFDPYWWAVKQNNALLPGLTNQLEDVAAALGWESDDTGLTGAVVGQRFQRWLANPCEATELDWAMHEAYCEDDVRALRHVYTAFKDADRVDGVASNGSDSNGSQTKDTAQGTLSDF